MHISNLQWQSDWDGEEVGYPDILVVNYCTSGSTNYYIDAETGAILEQWEDDDDEDNY